MIISREQAAEQRAMLAASTYARPTQRRAFSEEGPAAVRVARGFDVRTKAGKMPIVAGFASVTDTPYEMHDMFGPYTEVVALDAFDATLAADPLVEMTLNHNRGGGLPMAHTRNGTLVLSSVKDGDTTGLWYEGTVDPSRHDVSDMLKAMERGDLAESSFKFSITSGQWSPDFMEYHINAVDLHRGDVSPVNFGANPNATSGLVEKAAKIAGPRPDATDALRRVFIDEAETARRTA